MIGGFDGAVKLKTLNSTWSSPTGGCYTSCYVITDVYDGKIYYMESDKIMAMPLTGGAAETVYTLTAKEKKEGSLYGMVIDDSGLITYQVMPMPAFPDENTTDSNAVFHTYQIPSQQTVTTTAPAVTTTTEKVTTTAKVTTTVKATTTARVTTTRRRRTTTTAPVTTTTPKATTTTAKATTTTAKATTTTAKATTTTPKATTTTAKATTTTPKATTTTPKATTTTPKATTTVTTTTAKQIKITKRGDLNLDTHVDVADAVMLARLLVEDKNLIVTEQGMANSDCDGDTKITPDDLTWILRFIAKLIT